MDLPILRNLAGHWPRRLDLGIAGAFFVLMVLVVPGIAGAGTTPRWAFISIVFPLLIPSKTSPITAAHVFGLVVLWYAAISVGWSHHYDGLDALFKLIVCAEAFVLGNRLEDLRPIIIGSGLGIWVSSLAMMFDVDLPSTSPNGGMFVNSNVMGEISGLVLIAAIAYRLWWLIPGIVPALMFSQCRGALLAVGVCMGALVWRKSKLAVMGTAVIALFAVAINTYDFDSINQRLQMWGDVLPHLTLMGTGLGSFFTRYPLYSSMDTLAVRPDHLHNDWLELIVETGVMGFVAACGCIAFICRAASMERAILGVLAIEAIFGFPLHMAATAIVGFVVAGHAARDGMPLFDDVAAWRVLLRRSTSRI